MHVILVIDDNKNILDFCRREFEREGYIFAIKQDNCEVVELERELEVTKEHQLSHRKGTGGNKHTISLAG